MRALAHFLFSPSQRTNPVPIRLFVQNRTISDFLASQDALEVMLVSQSVSQSVTLRTELTDVTLVSEDTY